MASSSAENVTNKEIDTAPEDAAAYVPEKEPGAATAEEQEDEIEITGESGPKSVAKSTEADKENGEGDEADEDEDEDEFEIIDDDDEAGDFDDDDSDDEGYESEDGGDDGVGGNGKSLLAELYNDENDLEAEDEEDEEYVADGAAAVSTGIKRAAPGEDAGNSEPAAKKNKVIDVDAEDDEE